MVLTEEIWIALIAVFGTAIGWYSKTFSSKKGRQSADWQAYTDDLRGENAEMRESSAEMRSLQAAMQIQITDLWKAQYDGQAKFNAALGHISALERGIIDGTVPPLPERPFELRSALIV